MEFVFLEESTESLLSLLLTMWRHSENERSTCWEDSHQNLAILASHLGWTHWAWAPCGIEFKERLKWWLWGFTWGRLNIWRTIPSLVSFLPSHYAHWGCLIFLDCAMCWNTKMIRTQSLLSDNVPSLERQAHVLGHAHGWYGWLRWAPRPLNSATCLLFGAQFRCHFLLKASLSLTWCFLCVPIIFCVCCLFI